MSPRVQVPFPRLGLSEDVNAATQPPLTSPRARNVRLIDPKTGRARGAERAGMRAFFAADEVLDAGRIDYLAHVAYNAPKIEYTLLEGTDIDTAGPEWSVELPAPALEAIADFQGSIYVLLDDGRVQVFNPDGELQETLSVPLEAQERIAPALAVDEGRRVYVAKTGPQDAQESTLSTLYQFVLVEDEERQRTGAQRVVFYDRRWEWETHGAVRRIVAGGGAVWFIRATTAGTSLSELVKLGGATGTEPLEEWVLACPDPVNGLAISDVGEVYISSPSNANRGASPGLGGLHAPRTSWTPHDLGYNAAAHSNTSAEEYRLHAWVDAGWNQGNALAHGAEVAILRDRRYISTQNTAPGGGQPGGSSAAPSQYGTGPFDYTVRSVHKATENPRPGPTFRTGVVAGRSAVFFDRHAVGGPYPGNALGSWPNISGAFKADTTGPVEAGTDTDVTDVTIGTSFTDLSLTETLAGGLPTDSGATWLMRLTGQIRVGTGGTMLIGFRPMRGGVPTGPEVIKSYGPGLGTNDYPLEVDIPITVGSTSAGTYTVEARRVAAASAVVRGTVVTTTLALIYNDFQPDANGLLTAQQAIVPGHTGSNNFGDNWAFTTAWRCTDPATMQVVATQNGNTHKWAILANARVQGQTLTHSPGWVTLISNRMSGGSSAQFSVPGLPPDTFTQWRAVSGNSNTSASNPDGYMLLTFSMSGRAGVDSGAVDQSFFRVNGRPAGRFSIALMEAWNPGTVVLGNAHLHASQTSSDLFSFIAGAGPLPFTPFHGYFMEWVTVLGRTTNLTTQANDTPTTYPSSGGFPPSSGNSGSVNPAGYNTTAPDTGGSYTGTATEIERLEGGMAHSWGLANFLPNGTGGGGPLYADHPFGGAAFPPIGFNQNIQISDLDTVLLSPRPLVAKAGAHGAGFVWALNGSGVGNGVVALPGRYIATVGEKDAQDELRPNVVLRKIFDGGSNYSLSTSDGAWDFSDAGFTPTDERPGLVADEAGNIYWTRPETGSIRKHAAADGSLLVGLAASTGATSAALDPIVPVYPPGTAAGDEVPLFVYRAGPNLDKLRFVAEDQVIGDEAGPRSHRYIAVAGPSLYEGASGGVPAIVTGGLDFFGATRTYVTGAQLFQQVYITDGERYLVYEPVTNTARAMQSVGRGEIPKRGRLFASHEGRLVVARTQDDWSTLFMSRFGEPEDFDYFPPNPSVEDAWNSTLGVGFGSPPDMITALIELDDILIVGCDHSIYKVVGDPRAGGRIEMVSDQTGIAFGSSWCKDTLGRVYFFGQRGGVWRISRGLDSLVSAVRLSEYRIERQLQEINLSTHRVELVWDYKEEGLRLFPIPLDPDVEEEEEQALLAQLTKTWTVDADFDSGVKTDVDHVVADQLQIPETTTTLGYFFVSEGPSLGGRVAKFNVVTGERIGTYKAGPSSQPSASRMVVGADGGCWLVDRTASSPARVTKFGACYGGTRSNSSGTADPTGQYLAPPFGFNTGVDRNSDTLIRSSSDTTPLSWTTTTDGGTGGAATVTAADDECIILHQRITTIPVGTLDFAAAALAPNGDFWAIATGVFQGYTAYRFDGATGVVAQTVGLITLNGGTPDDTIGGFMAIVDATNVLWSSSRDSVFNPSTALRYSITGGTLTELAMGGLTGGIDTDSLGRVWFVRQASLRRLNADGTGGTNFGVASSNSLLYLTIDASDTIWVADTGATTRGVRRGTTAGTFTTPLIATTGLPVGITLDHTGKIWVPNVNTTSGTCRIERINPATNTVDLSVLIADFTNMSTQGDNTAGTTDVDSMLPAGTWTAIHDGQEPGITWKTITWTADEPGDSSITVFARASEAVRTLSSEPWLEVSDGVDFTLIGRYAEVRVEFERATDEYTSPILYDIELNGTQTVEPTLPPNFAGGSTGMSYDEKHGGWWPDTFGVGRRITCTAIFDADEPGDRMVAIGCGDGVVRIFDTTAADDDGVLIDSDVWIGPLNPGLPDVEMRVGQLQLAMKMDGAATVRFEWYVSTRPDIDFDTIEPWASGTVEDGLSPVKYARARGLYVFLRLRGLGFPWAYEAGSFQAEPAGRARQRT